MLRRATELEFVDTKAKLCPWMWWNIKMTTDRLSLFSIHKDMVLDDWKVEAVPEKGAMNGLLQIR
jgi:hypothetical protein